MKTLTPAEQALIKLVNGIAWATENEVQLIGICQISSKINRYKNCYAEASELVCGLLDQLRKENTESTAAS